MKNKLNVFVTGSTGFIGKNFIELYSDKYNLLTPGHRKLELLDSKSVDEYFAKNTIDIVLHLANRGGSQKEAGYKNPLDVNLRIFFNLVKNQDKFGKMIYVGSGAEYGKQFPIIKVRESDFGKLVPEDDFGLYKFIAAKYIEQSKKIINLRTFGVYGKYEDWHFKFISNSICRALFKKPITINNNCIFDYIYINDLLKIIDYFISHNSKFNTYNVGAVSHNQLKTIADKIVDISNAKIPVVIKNRSLGLEYTCNNSRLKNEIKGFKWTSANDAIDELFLWYRENIHLLDRSQLSSKRKDIWKK